jgi:hypothetical protein
MTKFEVGEKVQNTMRSREGVIVGAALDAGILLVDYGKGAERTSIKYLDITDAQRKKNERRILLESRREEREDFREFLRETERARKLAATPVETLKRTDPGALALLADYYKANGGRMEFCCAPRHVEKLANSISSNSSLSEVDAIDYINIVTEAAASPKHDIFMTDGLPEELSRRLSVLVWRPKDGIKTHARNGEIEVNSRALAEWLMREHGALPKKWR